MTRMHTLSAFGAALAMMLVTGCGGKSMASKATTPDAPATNPAQPESLFTPATQYKFYVPSSEAALKQDTEYGYLIVKTAPGFDVAAFGRLKMEVAGKISMGGYDYYRVHKDTNVLTALHLLQSAKGVLFVEPDQKVTLDADASGPITTDMDPLVAPQEWSVYLTKLKTAWTTYGFGPFRPTTVDIDTGINFSHEDFQKDGASIVKHAYSWFDVKTGSSIKPSGTNFAIAPYDYMNPTVAPVPSGVAGSVKTTDQKSADEGHGTHTAGTIAALGDNGKGVAGVNWQTDLVSYKCFNGGTSSTWNTYGSIYHLMANKADDGKTIPVNMSLGGPTASSFAIDIIENALQKKIVIIASMGNDGQNLAKYPAAYAGVIAVGATNGQDKKVHFSTGGRHISVSAPGYDIISTGNAKGDGAVNAYQSMSGTSMSAPFVTGLVSYMLTFNDKLTPGQIKTYLEKNADLVDGAKGFTEGLGYGRVNVLKTIAAVKADAEANPPVVPPTSYVDNPVNVMVTNKGVPMTNLPVYLYQLNDAGTISNYAACSITGTAQGTDPVFPAGVAMFNLLKPGKYAAIANVTGIQAQALLTVVAGATTPVTAEIAFNNDIYNVATFKNAGLTSGDADDAVSVYDKASGQLLVTYDYAALDSVSLMTKPSQDLLINITPYFDGLFFYGGEYTLAVSKSTDVVPYSNTTPAPGSITTPGVFVGSKAHASGDAQAITPYTSANPTLVYGEILSEDLMDGETVKQSAASGDWYSVTAP